MIDAVGNVKSLVAIGAGNPLCVATVDHLVGPRLRSAFLIDSDEDRLIAAAKHISDNGVTEIRTGGYRVDQTIEQREIVTEAFSLSDVDLAILAPLPPRTNPDARPHTIRDVRASLTDLVNLAEVTLEHFKRQGHGVLVIFSHSRGGPAAANNVGVRAGLLGADVVASTLVAEADERIKVIHARINPLASDRGRSGEMPAVDFADLSRAIVPEVRNSRQRTRNVTIDFPRSPTAAVRRWTPAPLRIGRRG